MRCPRCNKWMWSKEGILLCDCDIEREIKEEKEENEGKRE